MCHNILQEEDDDIPVSVAATGAAVTSDASVLAEQNGNLSTKLATLSLDDGIKEETTTINGNIIETESAVANETTKPEVTVTNKKKGKKVPANNNNNNNNGANPADGKDDAADIVDNHKNASPTGELINDGNGATVQV